MHVAGKMFRTGVVNAGSEEILERVATMIRSKLSDSKIMAKSDVFPFGATVSSLVTANKYLNWDPEDVLLASALPSSLNKKEHRYAFHIAYQAVRLAALMHDLGHPPFSHVTEAALGEVWTAVESKPAKTRTQRESEFAKLFAERKGDPSAEIHEKIGFEAAESLIRKTRSSLAARSNKDGGETALNPCIALLLISELTLGILSDGRKEGSVENKRLCHALHQITSSSLDADRVDYVCRDLSASWSQSVPDLDRMLNSMRWCDSG